MQDVFVCDLVATMKIYQGDFYNMYCDQTLKYTTYNFWAFKSLLDCKHENIHMRWVSDVNTKVCHLAFKVSN
jgi:hypothetical protein